MHNVLGAVVGAVGLDLTHGSLQYLWEVLSNFITCNSNIGGMKITCISQHMIGEDMLKEGSASACQR